MVAEEVSRAPTSSGRLGYPPVTAWRGAGSQALALCAAGYPVGGGPQEDVDAVPAEELPMGAPIPEGHLERALMAEGA